MLQLLDHRLQRRDQLVAGVADRDGHGDRHAPLARRTIGRAHQCLRGELRIRVGHHDHVILCAAQRLHALAVLGCRFIDVLRHRRRSHEADGRDIRIREQDVDRLAIAVDDIEHARAAAPPRASSSARRNAQEGSFSDGFRTNVLPQAMAIGNIHIGTMAGKLNGVMPAHTPTGWRSDQLSMPVPTLSENSPLSRCGMPQANSTTSVRA